MTNAELAILSLIAERPRHGYEIEREIEERRMEWTEMGLSSVYYLLKKIERKRLIEGQWEKAERGPARKVYQLTPLGSEALRAGLLDALSSPRHCYLPLQLGLANLPSIPQAKALAALQKYRDSLADQLAHVQARWEKQRLLPYSADAMFEYSTTMIETELTWVEGFITQMKARLHSEHGSGQALDEYSSRGVAQAM